MSEWARYLCGVPPRDIFDDASSNVGATRGMSGQVCSAVAFQPMVCHATGVAAPMGAERAATMSRGASDAERGTMSYPGRIRP